MEKPRITRIIYKDNESMADIRPYGEDNYLITQKIFGNMNDECVVLTIEELEKALDLAYELEDKKKKTG